MSTAKKILRAPLLHLALLGLVLLWLDRVTERPADHEIRLTTGVQQALEREFEARQGRAPTPQELPELYAQWVTEEALVREAIALGFHRTDVIARRRLAQTTRWILDRPLDPEALSESKLRAYYEANHDKYREPPRLSLRHVFFRLNSAVGDPTARAQVVLGRLRGGGDAAQEGDPFVRGRSFSARSRDELRAVFGDAFAERAFSVPPRQWAGPVRSTFGSHLVYVDEVHEGGLPPFEGVREAVLRDLSHEQRGLALEQSVNRVVSRYHVVRDPLEQP